MCWFMVTVRDILGVGWPSFGSNLARDPIFSSGIFKVFWALEVQPGKRSYKFSILGHGPGSVLTKYKYTLRYNSLATGRVLSAALMMSRMPCSYFHEHSIVDTSVEGALSFIL